MISRAASGGMSRRPTSLPTRSRVRFMADSRRRPVPAFIEQERRAHDRCRAVALLDARQRRRDSGRRRACLRVPRRRQLFALEAPRLSRPCRSGKKHSRQTRRAGLDRDPTDAEVIAAVKRSSAAIGPSASRGARFALAHSAMPLSGHRKGLRSETPQRCARCGWAALTAFAAASGIIGARSGLHERLVGGCERIRKPPRPPRTAPRPCGRISAGPAGPRPAARSEGRRS